MKMGLTGSPACIKYLLFIFNLIFLITGIVILSVGAVIQGVYHNYSDFLDDGYFSAPALLIAVGSIVLIISFFGCCGAVKENYCMVITFSVLLSFIFILQLAAGIAGYALKDRTAAVLDEKLGETIKKYGMKDQMEITKIWDNMQLELQCCGIHNASDWAKAVHLNDTDDSLPMSCCGRVFGDIGSSNCTLTSPTRFQPGCIDTLGNFVREYAVTIGGVGVGLAFVQLLGVVFSCFLARAIKQHYESV